jgi:dTDP-4-amino-4,6-dideoxygalactose transaminase
LRGDASGQNTPGDGTGTNDDDLAAGLRFMRNLGFRTLDDVVTVGTNGKMSEVCAAMGLTGLESFDQFIRVNYDNYCHYRHLQPVQLECAADRRHHSRADVGQAELGPRCALRESQRAALRLFTA